MGLTRLLRLRPSTPPEPPGPPRVLFLDDDAERARIFLEEKPEAVWVQTAAECVEKLAEAWDEIHLDHDLGGEQFVDIERNDCGMEVVRWLTAQARPHLRTARFRVHSHNMVAAANMTMQLVANGYDVTLHPFGAPPPPLPPEPEVIPWTKRVRMGLTRVWCFVRRRPIPGEYGTDSYGESGENPGESVDGIDLSWAMEEFRREAMPASEPQGQETQPDFGGTSAELRGSNVKTPVEPLDLNRATRPDAGSRQGEPELPKDLAPPDTPPHEA